MALFVADFLAAVHLAFVVPGTSHSAVAKSPSATLRLVKPLPASAPEFSEQDIAWIVQQLEEQGRFNLFEEIQHQNQEMLALLHEIHSLQSHRVEAQDSPAVA